MITIDQARIDNGPVRRGPFPRAQEWWDEFTGVGTTATVRDDGTVTLEPNGQFYDYATWMSTPKAERGEDCPVAERKMSAAEMRRAEARLLRWLPDLLKAAVVVAAPCTVEGCKLCADHCAGRIGSDHNCGAAGCPLSTTEVSR